MEVVGKGAYQLELPHRYCSLHPVFPMVKLKLADPDPFSGRHSEPPPKPELIDGQPEFEVEKILDSKTRWGGIWYLVHWKGYNTTHDQWEPARNLKNAPEIVAEFYRKNPGAPRQISRVIFETLPFTRRVDEPQRGGDVRAPFLPQHPTPNSSHLFAH